MTRAFPKPCEMKRRNLGVKITKDGRVIESPHRYNITKEQMWARQNGCCSNCGRYEGYAKNMHRHHLGGRGMGGSKRDDSKTVLWCERCHVEEHEGQRQGRPQSAGNR